MKKTKQQNASLLQGIIKVLLIMKLTIVLLLISLVQVSANGLSQSISLKLNNAELKKALFTIEKKANCRFLYNDDAVSSINAKVSINAENTPVTDVLNKIFVGTGLTYKLLDNHLIVLSTKESSIQDIKIKGRVVNASGDGVPSATVRVKGTNVVTSADITGRFTISVPENGTLVISSVGYNDAEVSVNGRSEVNVTLIASEKVLDQVVVIGYGTANKRDLTGSIVRLAGKEVADKPNLNPLSSLQGKISGVSIVNTGELGAEPDIRIRGTVSRTQTKPLYIVDGIFSDNIDYLNPSDIESMEVLKDPSSLAIFGVRGANGVIIVTSRKGKIGTMTVNFNASVGLKKMVDKLKLTDATGFKTLFSEQLTNAGSSAFDYSLYTANTDWQNEISQTGMITRNNISISSGTEKNKFYMGVGYQYEDAIVKYINQQKISLSVSDELKVSNAIKIGFDINGYQGQNPNNIGFGNAQNATPIVAPYNSTAKLFNILPIGSAQIDNPLKEVTLANGHYPSTTYRFVGNVYAEINFLKHFNFKTTYYGDLKFTDARTYNPFITMWDIGANKIDTTNTKSSIIQDKINEYRFQQDYLLTYKNRFGEHSLTILGGFSTVYNKYAELKVQGSQYTTGLALIIPDDKRQWYVDNRTFVDPTSIVVVTPDKDVFGNYYPYQWDQATVSYLARALYSFKGKYMLNASFRRDGSSDIANSNRFQNFGAVGAAWEISKENFMQKIQYLDYLKIKASWGVLGNQYTSIHYPFYPLLSSTASYAFGPGANQVPIQTYTPSFIPDPNLKWETITTYEGGFEFGLLKHLTGEFAYYSKLTKNLLTSYDGVNGSKPGITNAGEISNKGIELSLTYTGKISSNIGYVISGNMSTLKNEVKKIYLNSPVYDGPSIMQVGSPIGSFFGYVVDGVYQSAQDVANSPVNTVSSTTPGELKYKDITGNDTLTSDDRKVIGNPTPKVFYGFSAGLNYKGFDFSVDFQGVAGNQIFRSWGNGNGYATFNFRETRMNRWHGAGTSNWEPRIIQESLSNSTYMIESGSYLRIRNVQLGYNFSTADLSKLHVKSLRIYLSAQNLKTFKKNSGYTPEFKGTATQFGVDNGSYPIPAIYTLGLNVNF